MKDKSNVTKLPQQDICPCCGGQTHLSFENHSVRLTAAGNTEPPAYNLMIELGFSLLKKGDLWVATKGKSRFSAEGPLELLGLITLAFRKGNDWRVNDEMIEEFLQIDQNNQ